MIAESYDEAKKKLLLGDYSAESYFKENNYQLEYAYCKLFAGDSITAKQEFLKLKHKNLRADWAAKLIQFIDGYVTDHPTYFQIRNFLEIDLNLLIKAAQPSFVENIINGADIFYSINPESYKFIARVMLNNDFFDLAMFYLKKAKDKFYYDPEMHFMLANCNLKIGEKELAKISAKTCLNIVPEYLPAKKLLSGIEG